MFARAVKVGFWSYGCGVRAAALNNSIPLKVFRSRGVKDGAWPGIGGKWINRREDDGCFIWSTDPGHNSNCLTCLMQKEILQTERNRLSVTSKSKVGVCICGKRKGSCHDSSLWKLNPELETSQKIFHTMLYVCQPKTRNERALLNPPLIIINWGPCSNKLGPCCLNNPVI